jgi:ribosomal protein S14
MTIRSAESIMELEIRRLLEGLYAAYDGDNLIASAEGTAKEAAQSLVNQVYHLRSQEVFTRAKWKCEKCGRRRALQVHHRVFRSHGRKDVVSNLVALCQSCHESFHGRK